MNATDSYHIFVTLSCYMYIAIIVQFSIKQSEYIIFHIFPFEY
jgi:hypothetical protein